MCGGWRFANNDYKPTPQPGDFVRVILCGVCRKRARPPKFRVVKRSSIILVPKLDMRNEHKEFACRPDCYERFVRSEKVVRTPIGSCCHQTENRIEAVGRVIRTVWSKNGWKIPSNFFFVVDVPRFKKKVWIDLNSHIELISATDYLIKNVEWSKEEDPSPSHQAE